MFKRLKSFKLRQQCEQNERQTLDYITRSHHVGKHAYADKGARNNVLCRYSSLYTVTRSYTVAQMCDVTERCKAKRKHWT